MFARLALLAVLWPSTAFGQSCAAAITSVHWAGRGLDGAFEGAGQRFRVDPDLGRAMSLVESNLTATAVSPKGAQGLMQLMPGTSAALQVADPFNAHQNIYGGMAYLRQLANDRRFAGRPYMVLVAYNAGPNRTVFPSTSYQYADHVIAVYWQIKAAHGVLAPHPIGFLSAPRCGPHAPGAARIILIHGKISPSRRY
jgi:soluble lytic murein transglycosylase-like protein